MENNKFRVVYDDMPNDIVDKVSEKLKSFGLYIQELEGGDGFVEYEIRKIEK